jgi:hypothetical protein
MTGRLHYQAETWRAPIANLDPDGRRLYSLDSFDCERLCHRVSAGVVSGVYIELR